MLLLATFLYCAASAVIPVLPAELWMAGLVAKGVSAQALPAYVIAAAAGQMVGKALIFLVSRGTLRSQWLEQKAAKGRGSTYGGRFSQLLARAETSRRGQAVLCAVSAFVGLPPFLIVAVLLGSLKMPLNAFLIVGFLGRAGRFGLIVAVPSVAAEWLLH